MPARKASRGSLAGVSRDVAGHNLAIEWWPIDRPKPYLKNARKLSPRAVETLATSLRQFGWRQPIVVDLKDVIVAGHTRLLAAQACEMTTVPVHVARELTAAQIRAYRIMDNRSADETEWDESTLAQELAELQALEVDLSTTGFTDAETAELLKPDPLTDEDDVPPVPEAPVTRLGDLWLLGGHRVLCGDASESAGYRRVLPVAAPRLLWTDPPYDVDYVGKTKDALTIQGDGRSGLEALLKPVFANCAAVLAANSPFYVAHGGGPVQLGVWCAIPAEWRVHQQLTWVKDTMVLGHSDYHYRHESILYGYTAGPGRPGRGKREGSRWFGGDAQTTVLQFARPKRSEEHATMKPVDLIVRCLTNSSERGDVVLEPFAGSGSTLVACELTGRICCGIDIDPTYVDVIVLRWQAFTGQAATLEGTKRTFAEIAAERAKKGKK